MPIIRIDRLDRNVIRSNPTVLYVFGDNLARQGGYPNRDGWSNPRAGQAAACRGEPNAVGIPTKRQPSMRTDAFFSNEDLEKVRPIIQAEFRRLAEHLRSGGTVAIPTSGIGTERAQLAERAPVIRTFIDACFDHLNLLAEPDNPTSR
jgi:hypothetical protein